MVMLLRRKKRCEEENEEIVSKQEPLKGMSSLRMLPYWSNTLIFCWLKSLVVDWCVACWTFFTCMISKHSCAWRSTLAAWSFTKDGMKMLVIPQVLMVRCRHRPGEREQIRNRVTSILKPGWQVYGEPMGNGCNGCNGCGCGGCNGYGAQMYEDLSFNGYVPQHAYYQEQGLAVFFDEMSEKAIQLWEKFVQVGWWNVTAVCILNINWCPNDRRTWRWPTWITECRKEMYNHQVLILKYSGGFKSLEACKLIQQAIEWVLFLYVLPPENETKTQHNEGFLKPKHFWVWLIKIAVDRSMIHICSAGFLGQPLVTRVHNDLHQSIPPSIYKWSNPAIHSPIHLHPNPSHQNQKQLTSQTV